MATIGPSIALSSIGPSGSPDVAYSNLFATFQSPWGVAGQFQICSSFADFTRLYGGLNRLTAVASGTTADTYTVENTDAVVQAYYAIKGYFDEKGNNSPGVLYACRSVASSSGPTSASKTFADSAGTNNTTITSKWPGRDGATTQITVINPSPRKGIFTALAGTLAVTSGSAAVTGTGTAFVTGATWVGWGIKIGLNYYTILSVATATGLTLASNAVATETVAVGAVGNNTTSAYIKAYHPQSNITEEWDVGTASDAALVSKNSQLIQVTLPAGGQLPVSAVASKLNSGTSATADSYAATDADLVGTTTSAGVKTGLQVFNDQRLGTGFVSIPGKVSSTIRTGIKTHAETYYRQAIYGAAAGLTLTTAQTEFASISTNHGSAYVPRIWVTDQNSTAQGGGALLIDPSGHVAGLGARMDRDYRGPHKSPAGTDHQFNSVLDVERTSAGMELFDDNGSNLLADSYVNTIRMKRGPTVWGLRTLASDERYRQINMSRTVEYVYLSCYLILEKLTFEPIDPFGKLFARAKGDLDSFFATIWANGTIFGSQPGKEPKPNNAWFTVCDRGNNPNVSLGKGELRADVSFVPTPNAEKITLNLQVAAPGFGAASAGISG
jgi:phage tail sheath protein FI